MSFCQVFIFLSYLYFRSCGTVSALLLLDNIMTNSVCSMFCTDMDADMHINDGLSACIEYFSAAISMCSCS